jgi:8-oxo-dGTP pyrophosphatase MutT (NUDIX family)
MKKNKGWTTLSTQTKYDNPWMRVEESQVIAPSGIKTIYGVVRCKRLAVGIVPVDKDKNIWLVGQQRYPTENYSWEIPEGGGDLKVDPLETGKRELQEETGFSAKEWLKLAEVDISNCITDEKGVIYLARGLTQGNTKFDETEVLDIKKLPIEEAFSWVHEGRIKDSISMIGLLKLEIMVKTGKLLLD